MKLKTIAAAVVAVAAATTFTTAFAGIDTTNNAELFLVAFNGNGSYVKDLGIHLDAFLGSSGLANTAASSFSQNVGTAFAGFGTSTDMQWALLATDASGSGNVGDFRMIVSGTGNVQPDFGPASNLQDVVGAMSLQEVTINQTGTHTAALAVNGESFNAKGTAAYYDDSILTAGQTFTANPIGFSSSLWLAQNGTIDSSDPTKMTKLAGIASFNGTTISYTVTAVPEPETLALMFAGLGAVGFIARRRRA